jgi:hypothetical protein
MYLQKVSRKVKKSKKIIFVDSLKATDDKSRIRIHNSVQGSKDPDPYQYVTDPKHTGLKDLSQTAQALLSNYMKND